MSDFTSDGYVYFENKEEELKIHDKVFVLDQEPTFIIKTLGNIWGEMEIIAKIICKNIDPWVLIISKLLLNYQSSMHRKNINRKGNTCILEYKKKNIYFEIYCLLNYL